MVSSTENLTAQRCYIIDKEICEVVGVSQLTSWRWTKELGFLRRWKEWEGKTRTKSSLNGRKNVG